MAAANTTAPANTTAIGMAAPQEQAGAVGGNSDGQGTAGIGTQGTDVYGFMRLPFKKGQLLSQVVKPEAGKLSEKADLKDAYIVRGGKRIDVDLEKLLYAYEVKDDVVLQAEDRIVIPFGQDYAYVKGEVKKAVGVKVETNLRLSAALKDNLTQIASLRDITVKSVDGSVNVYDLFKAERYGDIRQDPYLRPGDVVEVARAQRIISISGEVRRPGTYQLLEGEGLPELVMIYGDGFTEKANPTRMSIVRYVSLTSPVGEKIQLDYTKDKDMTLSMYDSVNVPAYQDLLPVAWFEGAIGVSVEGAAPQAAQRVPYTFFPGEMVSQAAQSVRKSFSEVSDLKNVYISRKGTKIPVNLEDFLYNRDFTNDMPLQAGDVIVIPFRQFFVTVSGAVKVPGRYPYVPDRSWEYYVGLAGGIDTDKNSGQKLTIYDVNSKVQAKDRIIQPEDNIVVAANSFTYSFSRIAVIMSTIISVASLVIALLP
jgi:protein involved in polysaccharide export with SLBB domain